MHWTFFANATEDMNGCIRMLQGLMETRNRWNRSFNLKKFTESELIEAIKSNPKIAQTLNERDSYIDGCDMIDGCTLYEKAKNINKLIEHIRCEFAKHAMRSFTTTNALLVQTAVNSLYEKMMQAYGVKQHSPNALPVLLQRMFTNSQSMSCVISEGISNECPVVIDLNSSSFNHIAKFYILVGVRNIIAHATNAEYDTWKSNAMYDAKMRAKREVKLQAKASSSIVVETRAKASSSIVVEMCAKFEAKMQAKREAGMTKRIPIHGESMCVEHDCQIAIPQTSAKTRTMAPANNYATPAAIDFRRQILNYGGSDYDSDFDED